MKSDNKKDNFFENGCIKFGTSWNHLIFQAIQGSVCKKTSRFFPSPWHLCAWNNDRDFSSEMLYFLVCC